MGVCVWWWWYVGRCRYVFWCIVFGGAGPFWWLGCCYVHVSCCIVRVLVQRDCVVALLSLTPLLSLLMLLLLLCEILDVCTFLF